MTSLSPQATRRNVNNPNLRSSDLSDNNMWANNPEERKSTPNKIRETMPLIEATPAPPPPIAGPEIDDLDDSDDTHVSNAPYPGVDDGFFSKEPVDDPDVERIPPSIMPRAGPGDDEGTNPIVPNNKPPNGGPNVYPYNPETPFPYAPGFGPNDHRTELEFGGTPPASIPDVNEYQHKKTLAQGFLDLALFSANANQLRYVLESYERHPYYYPSVIMISFSLIFQVAIGVGLIWNARYNVKDDVEICVANKINNYTVIGIFLVTAINVFVSAFGVAPITAPVVVPP